MSEFEGVASGLNEALDGISPKGLWRHFSELSAIPRPSGHEQGTQVYVKSVADAAGIPWRQDQMGNLVLYIDGDSGPVVAVQTHLDMVCEKLPEVDHDFFNDPIQLARDGDRVFARGTTLGADNGIGAAAALALLTEPGIAHGPLELVFTVQEETGLHGAVAFDPGLMSATMLINLDSEDPDTLTVGCAGGSSVGITLPLAAEQAPPDWEAHRVIVSGVRGGHSGVSIHERRANAIKVLVKGLNALLETGTSLRLAGLEGGSAHNVIPRDASAVVLVPAGGSAELQRAIEQIEKDARQEWGSDEPDLRLTLAPADSPAQAMSSDGGAKLLALLSDLPHGVLAMSEHFPGKVETSANLAKVEATPESAQVLASVRSFSAQKGLEARTMIESLGARFGGSVVVEMGYPGWEPDPSSKLAKLAQEQFQLVNGKAPIVEVLHAGLECGVLVAKRPGLEAISFGPFIGGAHSPSEHVLVSTVESMWKLLVGLVGALRDR
jgi:dipeptidase D